MLQVLLQSATAFFITKRDGLLLQSATAFLLQSATSVITNCDSYYKVWQFYYKVRQVLQSATIITKCDSTKELITRPRCLSFSFQVFQGDWKKCAMRIYIWFLELWEFRDRQKLVIYISHMHFMVSIISKFVKAFSCTFYYYTKQFCHLSVKHTTKPLLHNRRRQAFQTSLRRVSDWKEAVWTAT